MQDQRQLKLNDITQVKGDIVLYVMARDQRVRDNHALLAAQAKANELRLPLGVVFNLLPNSGFRMAEHYEFMLTGLRQIEAELKKLNIGFWLTAGNPKSTLPDLFDRLRPAAIYFDFSPLRGPRALQKSLASMLNVPCVVVDAHNIIPVWVTSDKEEFAAHTIRRKIHNNLAKWLVEPTVAAKHDILSPHEPYADWQAAEKIVASSERNGTKVIQKSGEHAARQWLQTFCNTRLEGYVHARNNPVTDGQSGLSPYLHFGQLSSLRVALTLLDQAQGQAPLLLIEPRLASAGTPATRLDSINALLEDLIVRKELADNYCFFNTNYDSIDGAKAWARQTLDDQRSDPRDHLYSKQQWEQAETHDDAWNAAQTEMMRTGKMHGYMRMYWAKKILEWSATPEEAIATAISLNDKYSIDGRDPNGYVGIMWSICGIHDRPWFGRSVYGKIRYMNRSGLARRFELGEYIRANQC